MKESQHTEWKRNWRDDYLRWICGFANAEGGVLVIGLMLTFQANPEHLIAALGEDRAKPVLDGKVGERVGETRVEMPVVTVETPEVRVETPEVRVETPEVRVETPEVRVETPEVRVETPEVRVETPEVRVETPVETRDRIIELLRAHPHLTLGEVAAQIGKSVSTVERSSVKLTREGRLRRVGPRKGGHWEVLQ